MIAMESVLPSSWGSLAEMAEDFQVPIESFDRVKFLIAFYEQGNYSGHSFVLFFLDGQLFENFGSHCSCYGLGGMWEPEETTMEALRHHFDHDEYQFEGCRGQVEAILLQAEARKLATDLLAEMAGDA